MNNQADFCLIIKKDKLYIKNNHTMFTFKYFNSIIKDFNVDIKLNSIHKLKMMAKMLKIRDVYNKKDLIYLIEQRIVYLN